MTTPHRPDLQALRREPWWQAMAATPQDPVYHPEGDVAVHTERVVDAVRSDPDVQDLPDPDRSILEWAAVLHDVGKPDTTVEEEDGHITSRGHSRCGEILARRILWERGMDVRARERICRLVRTHMRPGFLVEKADPKAELIYLSHASELRPLTYLARGDTRGRGGESRDALARVDLFEGAAKEAGVWDRPWPFANDVSRFQYFRRPDRNPHYTAHDETWGEVVIMSGLPGAGKDHWLEHERPDLAVVSLDAIRAELGFRPDETPGQVIHAARERAREFLRDRTPFAWNATNLSRDIRRRPLNLAADYGARIRIVHVEATPETLTRQNEARSDRVPAAVIDSLLDKWEFPLPMEAHQVDSVQNR